MSFIILSSAEEEKTKENVDIYREERFSDLVDAAEYHRRKIHLQTNIVDEKHIDDDVVTSERGSVVVAMVVTTVELVKSCIEAWRNIVATARLANTIINHSTLPPDLTLQQQQKY